MGDPRRSPESASRSAAGAWRRRGAFAVLYFAEGAPQGFLWYALPTILAGAGVSPARIGALASMLVLPWSLKVLWAPALDALRGPRWSLRSSIVAAQVCMAATLAPLAWTAPEQWVGALWPLLIAHAYFAATHDVAIDALAIASAPANERGPLNAWMQAGMWAGRALFGGGALVVRERLGDGAIVLALVAVLAAVLAVSRWLAEPQLRPGALVDRLGEVGGALARAGRDRTTWIALGFAATAGAGFEGIGLFAGPWLRASGASERAVGLFFAVPMIVCVVLGGFAGGRFVAKSTSARGTALGLVGVIACATAVAIADAAGAGVLGRQATLLAMYFAIGAFTAASYALFMDWTDPRVGSTQFSAYMGATNLCEAWSVRAAGMLAHRLGYATAFAALAAASALSLAWLLGLRVRDRGDVA